MLQNIRERSQGWFAWIIIVAVCITFALWGISSYFRGGAGGNVVAKVNGVEITQSAFSATYNQFKQQAAMRLGHYPDAKLSQILKEQALQGMISDIILHQAAYKAHFRTDPSVVEATIASLPAFQDHGVFSKERFERFLMGMMYTTEQFMQQISDGILARQVHMGVMGTGFVLSNEVDRAVQLTKQQRSFNYVIIPAARFMHTAQPDEQAVQDYYKAHASDFTVPEKVSIEYIELSLNDLMQKIQPTTAELEAFYQSHNASFPKSTFDSARDRVLQSYRQYKAQAEFADLSDQLANVTYENPNTLQNAADQLKLSIQSTPLFTKDGPYAGIAKKPQIVTAAFSDDVIGGNNSDPINISDDTVVVLRVKKHIPQSVKPLSIVKPTVVDKLRQETAQKEAQKLGDQIVTQMQKGAYFAKLAKQYQLPLRNSGYVTIQDKAINPIVLKAAFDLPRPAHENLTSDRGVALPSGDYAVVSLSKITLGNPKTLSSSERAQFTQGLEQGLGTQDYQLYHHDLMQKAKIVKYNQED